MFSLAADPRDRLGDVDGWDGARGEESRIKIDLAVGDGDHVGRDIGGDFSLRSLDKGQRRHAAASQ